MPYNFEYTRGGVWDRFIRDAAKQKPLPPIQIATYNMSLYPTSGFGRALSLVSQKYVVQIFLGLPELQASRHAVYQRVESFPRVQWKFSEASHAKLALCGNVGFTGSINLGLGDWHETAVWLTPDQCRQAGKVFADLWNSKDNLTVDDLHAKLFVPTTAVDLSNILTAKVRKPFK